ncbi:cell wall hydrolase [Neobacillus sp. GCM10023253]|uniref:cell wall hydrolase n=1 Tax=Neobacillus sp. GCM10023253 TaxID=3252644 RepID=UPI0036070C91
MKKTYIKTLIVACVATSSFIGISKSAEAITEDRVVTENIPISLEQKYGGITENDQQDNTSNYNQIDTEEIMQQPEKTKEVALHSTKPEIGITRQMPEKQPEPPAISISNNEKDLFARLVEAEAKGESYQGKVAVATVVLNRVESPHFPKTVTGVINQVVGHAYAFSPVQNGEIKKPASDESRQAVEEALTRKDRLNDSVYFYNPAIATDKWIRTRPVVMTIGHHVFAK